MKLKQLVSLLQQVAPFQNPKVKLEQYPTSPEVASQIIFSIANKDNNIQGNSIVDLGVGTGMLTIGLLAYDPAFLLGVDIDPDALDTCSENIVDLFMDEDDAKRPNYDLLLADVCYHSYFSEFKNGFDIAIMNPPFGTKNNRGVDISFLMRGIDLANVAVYSMHKTSTRSYIRKVVTELGHDFSVEAELQFDIPSMYRFHKQDTKDILVDLIKVTI